MMYREQCVWRTLFQATVQYVFGAKKSILVIILVTFNKGQIHDCSLKNKKYSIEGKINFLQNYQ